MLVRMVLPLFALLLAGCAEGVPPSPSSDKDDAMLLMMMGAGLNGYNNGRAQEQAHMPLMTTCTTTNGITNCLTQ